MEEITPEARARIDAYDGGIAYFDAMFGNLLDHLDALGIGRQAVVALTADHGESLAEHRVPFAHDALYDATVHVPLIVRAPGALPAGRVVEALSQAVDVAPTLLDLAGLPEAAADSQHPGALLAPPCHRAGPRRSTSGPTPSGRATWPRAPSVTSGTS